MEKTTLQSSGRPAKCHTAFETGLKSPIQAPTPCSCCPAFCVPTLSLGNRPKERCGCLERAALPLLLLEPPSLGCWDFPGAALLAQQPQTPLYWQSRVCWNSRPGSCCEPLILCWQNRQCRWKGQGGLALPEPADLSEVAVAKGQLLPDLCNRAFLFILFSGSNSPGL